MKVELKFSVRDLVGDARDGEYDVPEDSTVGALVETALEKAGKPLTEEAKNALVFLVNGRPAPWETALKEGDKVRVLFKILGG